MAFIKTLNPLDMSGGHCHTGTPPAIAGANNTGVRVNGFLVMLYYQGAYSSASCGDNSHDRITSLIGPSHANVRINSIPVFTSDDFIACGEPAGVGISPVFVN